MLIKTNRMLHWPKFQRIQNTSRYNYYIIFLDWLMKFVVVYSERECKYSNTSFHMKKKTHTQCLLDVSKQKSLALSRK